MLIESKVTKYVFYAIGEIILVVIGILIALQINNANDANPIRERELQYLSNIQIDLKANKVQLEEFIQARLNKIETAKVIIDHFEGKPIKDFSVFNEQIISIYNWKRFFSINTTFKELVNSGKLSIISNPKIQTLLPEIESKSQTMKSEGDHYRFDAETYS